LRPPCPIPTLSISISISPTSGSTPAAARCACRALLDVLAQDLASFRGEPAIERLRYAKGGNGAEAHDLKPPPGKFAEYLSELVTGGSRRSLALAAAFATDGAADTTATPSRRRAISPPGSKSCSRWSASSSPGCAARTSRRRCSDRGGTSGLSPCCSGTTPFIRVAPVGDRIMTTGCTGECSFAPAGVARPALSR
jgi:hypothetical protein